MEAGAAQMALHVLDIVVAAAATFYVISFNELREKSFELDDMDDDGRDEFDSPASSRERRARRKAQRKKKK